MKKGFNWKARKVVHVDIDNSQTSKLQVDLPDSSRYDKSNAFVLPEKKRKTKIKDTRPKVTKILSNKHRKRLEKVVDRRKKKANRASLLDSLSKVQAPLEELQQLVSISSVQTKGLKRHFLEQQFPEKLIAKATLRVSNDNYALNSLQGSKRKRIDALYDKKVISTDPNVVGFEESSSDDSSSEENEEKEELPNFNKKVALEDVFKVDSKKKKIEEPNSVKNKILVDNKLENKEKSTIFERCLNSSTVKENIKPIVKKPAIYVDVIRTPEVQAARLKLPILAEEQLIMETISENDVVILAGETGSGKTTQLPQFLYEAGYALGETTIAVTQPRRVAAIAMSKRVAHEMSLGSDQVSYVIRFEGNVTDNTKIKFMTDGVLLKEMQNDFMLSKYSVIILDEAHERSVYTDILVGLLSRVVPMRKKKTPSNPLKLIVMSATLKLTDFTENRRLFKVPPPVVKVEARQFPVTVHFNKRTKDDYLREAYLKTCKVHNRLPEGGILIFVTGQAEVNSLVRKLQKTFPYRTHSLPTISQPSKSRKKKQLKLTTTPIVNLDDYSLPGDLDDVDNDVTEEELALSDNDEDMDDIVIDRSQPLWVLPLYSMLNSQEQARVFDDVPEGCRLCVVSTNVAETSLTIPHIRYVIDTGRTKLRLYDHVTGVGRYDVTWTSWAGAEQRAGRAGRTGPGHCYRLYSSAVFNDEFKRFAHPDIQCRPVDELYLQMRCMGVERVVNFPFPTAPDLLQLKTAEYRLGILGALTMPANEGATSDVTPLGRAIARFPLLPRFGKMLALSHQHNLLPYTICLVAALSVQEVLLETPIGGAGEPQQQRDKWRQIRQYWAGTGNSLLLGDAMVLLKAVGGAEFANSQGKLDQFCLDNGLRVKALLEIRKLRLQLTAEIRTNVPDADVSVDPQLAPPTDVQAKLLRQILLAGMGDQVARKVSLSSLASLPPSDRCKYKYAYAANNMADVVHLRLGCVLRKALPEYVVWQEVYEVGGGGADGSGDSRMYMRGVTGVEQEWLPTYVPGLCQLSAPLEEPPPRYDPISGKVHCTVNGTFGSQAWPISAIDIPYPITDAHRHKWFAHFLLSGAVCPPLARYTAALLSPAHTVVRGWAKMQPRVLGLVRCLTVHDVRSRGRLEELWGEDNKFLLPEYLKWLPSSAHEEIKLIWPPVQKK